MAETKNPRIVDLDMADVDVRYSAMGPRHCGIPTVKIGYRKYACCLCGKVIRV